MKKEFFKKRLLKPKFLAARSALLFLLRKSGNFLFLSIIILGVSACSTISPYEWIKELRAPHRGVLRDSAYRPFAWGVSTSSLQYENRGELPGSPNYFERDWDLLVKRKEAPLLGEALWSWSDFEKDFEALQKLHVNAYRFSIEWARVEPQPGHYNQKAIDRYVAMAKKLKDAGIEPYVCLWHFSFPSWLTQPHQQSNWLNPQARSRWDAYVTKMVQSLSPYVTYYAPQNEPNGQILTAYIAGLWPPNHSLDFKRYHAAMRASALMFRDAAKIIKQKEPQAKVLSIEAIPYWYEGVFDPGGIIYKTVEGNAFDHLDAIYDVCDIVGFNYYYSQVAGPLSLLTESSRHGPRFTMMGWRIDPEAFGKLIVKIAKRYGKPMMVTENGIATENEEKRIEYLEAHLAQIAQAQRHGYDVRGYFIWSLADNYEWHYGYEPKFGLTYFNKKSWKLQFKDSAYYYRDVIDSSEKEGQVVPIPPGFDQQKPH